jgi:DNA-binding response OmpR family regulator
VSSVPLWCACLAKSCCSVSFDAGQGETVDRDESIATIYEVRPEKGNTLHLHSRLDALIFRLRGKLETEAQQIESIRGQGYRLVSTK